MTNQLTPETHPHAGDPIGYAREVDQGRRRRHTAASEAFARAADAYSCARGRMFALCHTFRTTTAYVLECVRSCR